MSCVILSEAKNLVCSVAACCHVQRRSKLRRYILSSSSGFHSLRMTTIITGFAVTRLCFIFSGTVFSSSSLAAETKKVDARKIYDNNCAKCHGSLGKPTKRGQSLGAPNFSSRFWQVSITDEQIIEAITHGKNKMPGWRKVLGPEEIKAAARWVRVLSPRKKR